MKKSTKIGVLNYTDSSDSSCEYFIGISGKGLQEDGKTETKKSGQIKSLSNLKWGKWKNTVHIADLCCDFVKPYYNVPQVTSSDVENKDATIKEMVQRIMNIRNYSSSKNIKTTDKIYSIIKNNGFNERLKNSYSRTEEDIKFRAGFFSSLTNMTNDQATQELERLCTFLYPTKARENLGKYINIRHQEMKNF